MKNWKAILGVTGIFLLGMLAGALVVVGLVLPRVERVMHGGPVFTASEVTGHFARRLKLDPGQRAQVLEIVADTQRQIHDVRQQCAPQTRAVIDAAVVRTRALLRPDQQAKFDQLVARYSARFRQ